MRALRWHAPRDVRLESVPEPAAGAGDVLVQVEWCGLCGTDVHEYAHGPVLIPARPHPLTGRTAPVTLGHEFSGTVVRAGAETGFRDGERVTANACLVCHDCPWCRTKAYNLCARLGSIGLCADGALAELVSVPAYALHRVPAELSSEVAAMAEPAAVAVHACRRARLAGGEVVAVVGGGPIGLLVLQAARALGAGRAFVVEPLEARRELAVRLGAERGFDPLEPVDKAIAAATGERRADVAFECTGSTRGLETALRVSGKGGRIVAVGIYGEASPAPWPRIQAHEKEIIGSSAYTNEFPETIALLASGRIQGAPLVSDRIPLAEVERAGLRALLEEPARHMKILVRP